MRYAAFQLIRLAMRVSTLLIRVFLLLLGKAAFKHQADEIKVRDMARRESQSHMNEFISVISHDLKTPLTSIKGNIQLIGRRLKRNVSPELVPTEDMHTVLQETRDLLERTDKQVNRLTTVVNSLLESSRIQGNTMDLLFELCELNAVLEEVLEDARYIPEERVIQTVQPEGSSVLVMGDVNRIKQVIIQYLSNAHKYSTAEHPITVTLTVNGQEARVEVQDKGQGIPVHEQKQIWERYYRVPDIRVLNGTYIGLGLGLHISRTIIEQHRGKVGVQSVPGKGSTFWFTLPLARKAAAMD